MCLQKDTTTVQEYTTRKQIEKTKTKQPWSHHAFVTLAEFRTVFSIFHTLSLMESILEKTFLKFLRLIND